MDARIKKTQKSIHDAFVELRKEKPIEKITIKELCKMAQINKSTFYLHYDDIYSLSDSIEKEFVERIVESVFHKRKIQLEDQVEFTLELSQAFIDNKESIDVLFSGNQQGKFATHLEEAIKHVFSMENQSLMSHKIQVLLTYCVQGGYHAYLNNPNIEEKEIKEILKEIAVALNPVFKTV